MEYLTLKWIHILSATLMFGTGLGSAFYKFMADRSGNAEAIAHTNRIVVWADWLFTTPTIILQPITGVMLAFALGYPLNSSWLVMSIMLYIVAGLCWLPVVYLQILMKSLSQSAVTTQSPLSPDYHRLARAWFWLGVPAFTALVVIYYLMIFKPQLW
ncbi:MAG: DUF2269 domain-containing protein [Thiohalobacteraceae bacterium]